MPHVHRARREIWQLFKAFNLETCHKFKLPFCIHAIVSSYTSVRTMQFSVKFNQDVCQKYKQISFPPEVRNGKQSKHNRRKEKITDVIRQYETKVRNTNILQKKDT
uniref:Uncharacterized protein n=1 Tax=Cacopsylla melanoneura TaxID=428564 RepID=A0A8D9BUQ7_9HEMI